MLGEVSGLTAMASGRVGRGGTTRLMSILFEQMEGETDHVVLDEWFVGQ